MRFDVLTLYPDLVLGPLSASIPGRAIEKGIAQVVCHQIRDFALDKHASVDHAPFGGGAGMVMRADVLANAWESAIAAVPEQEAYSILLSPTGTALKQAKVEALARGEGIEKSSATTPANKQKKFSRLILICGRFEGVDQRFIDRYVDEEISLGDFVLSGGEVAAAALMDAMIRLLPGAVGNAESLAGESFSTQSKGLLEYPHYTQPREFNGAGVPEVLVSGDHKKIAAWRAEQSLERTLERRPELAQAEARPKAPVYAALMHHDMVDKQGKLVTTSITNLDIHDIARSSRTYGLQGYFLVNPEPEQQRIAKRIMGHWVEGGGREYNPDRSEAFTLTRVVSWVEDAVAAIREETRQEPLVVMTSAREVPGTRKIDFTGLRQQIWANPRPILLVFGTGWGIEESRLQTAEAVLVPIRPQWDSDYRHLSVRAAAVTVFDRLLGEIHARHKTSS